MELNGISKTYFFDLLKTDCPLKWPEKLQPLRAGTNLAKITLRNSDKDSPLAVSNYVR